MGHQALCFKIDDIKHWQDDSYQEHNEHGVPPLDSAVRTVSSVPLPRLGQGPLQRLPAVLRVQLHLHLRGVLDALVDAPEVLAEAPGASGAARGGLGLRRLHSRQAGLGGPRRRRPQGPGALREEPMRPHRDLDGLQRVQILLPDEVVDAFDICNLQNPERTQTVRAGQARSEARSSHKTSVARSHQGVKAGPGWEQFDVLQRFTISSRAAPGPAG